MEIDNLVSVIIPTRNEERNIKTLVETIVKIKAPMQFEIVVVDNSDDRTAETAELMGCRVVKGQRLGLGQAIIDGIEAARGDIALVMDADLSHDPYSIPDY